MKIIPQKQHKVAKYPRVGVGGFTLGIILTAAVLRLDHYTGEGWSPSGTGHPTNRESCAQDYEETQLEETHPIRGSALFTIYKLINNRNLFQTTVD